MSRSWNARRTEPDFLSTFRPKQARFPGAWPLAQRLRLCRHMQSPGNHVNVTRARLFIAASTASAVLLSACGGSRDARASGKKDSTKVDSAQGEVRQVAYDSASYKAAFDSATKGKIKSTDS